MDKTQLPFLEKNMADKKNMATKHSVVFVPLLKEVALRMVYLNALKRMVKELGKY